MYINYICHWPWQPKINTGEAEHLFGDSMQEVGVKSAFISTRLFKQDDGRTSVKAVRRSK